MGAAAGSEGGAAMSGLRDCIRTGEEGTGRIKLSPSVGQSGDTGEGRAGDGGVENELENDELGDGEHKDGMKIGLELREVLSDGEEIDFDSIP